MNPRQLVLLDSPPSFRITETEKESGRKWVSIIRQTLREKKMDKEEIIQWIRKETRLDGMTPPEIAYESCPENFGEMEMVGWNAYLEYGDSNYVMIPSHLELVRC